MRMPEEAARVVTEETVAKLASSDEFVVKIVRPCSAEKPSFEIYDEEGLLFVYDFDTEVGVKLRAMIGDEGTTYHKAKIIEGSHEFAFEGTPLEDLDW